MTERAITVRSAPTPTVPAPPSVGDVVRHGAQIGIGAVGLAGRAMGRMLAPRPAHTERSATDEGVGFAEPVGGDGIGDLLPGAVLGAGIVVGRHVQVVVGRAADVVDGVARNVTAPPVVRRALRPLEDLLWQLDEVARAQSARNRADASAFMPVLVQQVTENVIAQLDLVALVRQVPIDDIVAELDVEAIIARLDLGGIIRESTLSVTGEAVDALRGQGVALDSFVERLVDRLLLRQGPRDLELPDPVAR